MHEEEEEDSLKFNKNEYNNERKKFCNKNLRLARRRRRILSVGENTQRSREPG